MDEQRRSELAQRLAAAGAAHGEYESNALHGEYDQQWAEWYARFLLEQGWNTLFERVWTADELAAALREADAAHRAHAPDARWYEYYAAHLVKLA